MHPPGNLHFCLHVRERASGMSLVLVNFNYCEFYSQLSKVIEETNCGLLNVIGLRNFTKSLLIVDIWWTAPLRACRPITAGVAMLSVAPHHLFHWHLPYPHTVNILCCHDRVMRSTMCVWCLSVCLSYWWWYINCTLCVSFTICIGLRLKYMQYNRVRATCSPQTNETESQIAWEVVFKHCLIASVFTCCGYSSSSTELNIAHGGSRRLADWLWIYVSWCCACGHVCVFLCVCTCFYSLFLFFIFNCLFVVEHG